MIKKPVTYQERNYKEIDNAKHNWEDSRASDTRKDIRDHLIKEFNKTCCYCQSKIRGGTAKPEIEHVVHKKKYKQFTYHPKNLVLVCRNCNTLKNTAETLIPDIRDPNCSFNDYPSDPSAFLIIHPYFDSYDKHIEIEGSLFYQPKNRSKKGLQTIEICNLYRLQLAEDRAKDLLEEINLYERVFSKAVCFATDEELRELTQQHLDISFDTIDAVLSITSKSSVVNAAESLNKIKNICMLNKENLDLMKDLYKMQKEFIGYLKILQKIKEDNNFLKDAFTAYLDRINLISGTSNLELMFSKDMYDAINKGIFEKTTGIDGRKLKGIGNLFKEFDTFNLSKRDFCILMELRNKASLLLNLTQVFIQVLKNREVKIVCEEMKMSPELLNSIEKDLNTLGKREDYDRELKMLAKFRYILDVEDFKKKDLKEIAKVLNKYLKDSFKF